MLVPEIELAVIIFNYISCPFGRYRYIKLPFWLELAGDIFQMIDELFNGMPNVFSIADDIWIAGFD